MAQLVRYREHACVYVYMCICIPTSTAHTTHAAVRLGLAHVSLLPGVPFLCSPLSFPVSQFIVSLPTVSLPNVSLSPMSLSPPILSPTTVSLSLSLSLSLSPNLVRDGRLENRKERREARAGKHTIHPVRRQHRLEPTVGQEIIHQAKAEADARGGQAGCFKGYG